MGNGLETDVASALNVPTSKAFDPSDYIAIVLTKKQRSVLGFGPDVYLDRDPNLDLVYTTVFGYAGGKQFYEGERYPFTEVTYPHPRGSTSFFGLRALPGTVVYTDHTEVDSVLPRRNRWYAYASTVP